MTQPAPKLTMDLSMKVLRTLHPMMFLSAIMLVVVGEVVASKTTPAVSDEVFWVIALLGFFNFAAVIAIKQMMIKPAAELIVSANPPPAEAIGKWQAGHILSFAVAESIVLFSLALRFMGFPLGRTAYFIAAGVVALLIVTPSDPRR